MILHILHLESPHLRYQWLKWYIRVYTSIYEHIQCPMISYHIPVYRSDMNHIGPYRWYIHRYGFCRKHKRVYTRLGDITVYDGIWLFMTVYDVPGKDIQVYTIMNDVYDCLRTVYHGIFLYIHVSNLTNWFVSCCTRPAGPPESCKSAAATSPHKTHSSSSTIVFTFCIFCRPPGPLGRDWHCSGGSGRVRYPPGTARAGSFALQQSM